MKQKRTPQQQKRLQYSGILFVALALGLIYLAYNHQRDLQARAIVNMFSGIGTEISVTDTPTSLSNVITDVDATLTPVCFFNWAYGDVPENDVTAIRLALDEAGYDDAMLNISAYGEDDVCQIGDEVVSTRFLLMDITPTIRLTVNGDTLNNRTELGRIVRDLTSTIIDISDISRIGYIEIDFVSGEDNQFWRANLGDITTTLADEINDNALHGIGINAG